MKRIIRPIRIEGNIAHVPLTKGYEAVIDVADVELVSAFNWYAAMGTQKNAAYQNAYACRRVTIDGKPKHLRMHRVILPTEMPHVDHIDCNSLNNRRSNLRPASVPENNFNRRMTKANNSGVKGVSWNKEHKMWSAYISRERRRKHLGYFHSAEEASAARDAATAKVHGEFGRKCEEPK